MVSAMIFNKIYLKTRFAEVLQMEGDGPNNLINFSFFISCAVVFVLNCILIICLRSQGDFNVPVGACFYMFITSVLLGSFAIKANIKLYFFHYIQRVYHSSPVLQYLLDLTTKFQRGCKWILHRGRVMPSSDGTQWLSINIHLYSLSATVFIYGQRRKQFSAPHWKNTDGAMVRFFFI